MLMHNGRLANPFDPHTQRLKSLTSKRKKTDQDLFNIIQYEARGGFWETEDELVGVPTAAVWRCFYDAAKQFKLGTTVKKALYFDDVVEPLLIQGGKVSCDDYLKRPDAIDIKTVKVQTSTTVRARPKIPTGWETTHTFELFVDVLDEHEIEQVMHSAGRLYGLGDWRPTYGRFTVEVV
jgi:hypothetical protein